MPTAFGEAVVSSCPVHFRSTTDEWPTPSDLFNRLHSEFGFQTDVCATPSNAKCEKFFTPEQDGLKQNWRGICWMNPPYGRQIGLWLKKAPGFRPRWRYCSLPRTRPHRHFLVARLLCKGRNSFSARSFEIRDGKKQCALSVSSRDFQTRNRGNMKHRQPLFQSINFRTGLPSWGWSQMVEDWKSEPHTIRIDRAPIAPSIASDLVAALSIPGGAE